MTTARVRAFWGSLNDGQRRSLAGMAAVVGGLHVAGFVTLLVVVDHGRDAGAARALTVGVGLTAYALGLRHAFDADHICAIDNTTRKLIAENKRPLSVGFWFSLGHSTVVFALTFAIALGVRALDGPVVRDNSSLHQVTGGVGTLVSGSFLYLIAAINLVVLFGVSRVFVAMRTGRYDERTLEAQLDSRGLMNRVFGRLSDTVNTPARMYPVGLLFGLGFDTATEVALLVLAGGAAGAGLPWYATLCLPVLFAAGMSLIDSLDGSFMNFAYQWASAKPVRRVYYNLAITGLSVAVAAVVGTIELGGLAASRLSLSGSFWTWLEHVDIGSLGMVIVAMFVLTWAIALTVWRWARIEERWGVNAEELR